MKLLSSFENEPERCSGINLIEGDVKSFQINKRIGHMGWNSINKINDHKILENVKLNADFILFILIILRLLIVQIL